MKKIFLNLLVLSSFGLFAVSCQSDKKAKDTDSTAVAVQSDSTVKKQATADSTRAANAQPVTQAEVEKAKVEAPDFSNEEVNNGFNEFKGLKDSYQTALKEKNQQAIKTAREKYNNWILKAATWGSKVSKEENQKYIDYYEKVVKQWEIVERQAKNK